MLLVFLLNKFIYFVQPSLRHINTSSQCQDGRAYEYFDPTAEAGDKAVIKIFPLTYAGTSLRGGTKVC